MFIVPFYHMQSYVISQVKCTQYWPERNKSFSAGPVLVKLIENKEYAFYTERKLSVSNKQVWYLNQLKIVFLFTRLINKPHMTELLKILLIKSIFYSHDWNLQDNLRNLQHVKFYEYIQSFHAYLFPFYAILWCAILMIGYNDFGAMLWD